MIVHVQGRTARPGTGGPGLVAYVVMMFFAYTVFLDLGEKHQQGPIFFRQRLIIIRLFCPVPAARYRFLSPYT